MSSGSGWGRTALKLSPLALPFGVIFFGGLLLAGAQSFGLLLPFPYEGGTWDGYVALAQPHMLASFAISLWVGLASALLSVVLGAVFGYGIWRLPHALQRAAVVYKTPLILPHIVAAFIVLVFFSQSGFLSSVGHQLGLVDVPADFPPVLFSGFGAGMILAYVYKSTPFVILLVYAVLRRMDPRLVQTAFMFGATRTQVFLRVVLPHVRSVLHTSFIILFLYAFGAFDIPFLLGESNPSMLSVQVYNLYFERDLINRPTAMAMLVCMFLFSAAFIAAYTRVAMRLSAGERKL